MQKIYNLLAILAFFSTTSVMAAAGVPMPHDWDGPILQGPPAGPAQCDANVLPNIAAIHHIDRDIAYASASPSEKLDIYHPNSVKGSVPAIIFIHGGAFFGCDKFDGQANAAIQGVQHGYVVVSVNYRLSPEAGWPAQINDVKAAIKFIRKNAAQYGIDPSRIVLWGDSAGANLAALAGVSAGVKALEDPSLGNEDVSTKVLAVIDWFGPINFLTMDEQWEQLGVNGDKHSTLGSFESLLMRAQITKVPSKVASANPENYITPTAPRFLIQHGDKDTTVPYLQSVHFAKRLKDAGVSTEFNVLSGAHHADWKYFLSSENINIVFKFIDSATAK